MLQFRDVEVKQGAVIHIPHIELFNSDKTQQLNWTWTCTIYWYEFILKQYNTFNLLISPVCQMGPNILWAGYDCFKYHTTIQIKYYKPHFQCTTRKPNGQNWEPPWFIVFCWLRNSFWNGNGSYISCITLCSWNSTLLLWYIYNYVYLLQFITLHKTK